jgi:hypothetical protein
MSNAHSLREARMQRPNARLTLRGRLRLVRVVKDNVVAVGAESRRGPPARSRGQGGTTLVGTRRRGGTPPRDFCHRRGRQQGGNTPPCTNRKTLDD